MIQKTTSLQKIASLRKKIRIIQGGQGAGKTISILILLINHAASKENKEILIISSELTKMRLTVIKDFVKVMRLAGLYEDSRFIAGTLYRFKNGSFIKFIGLDKSDVGKGLRSDVAYFNEVNKIDFESYRQVASRTKIVYADFNADKEFFGQGLVQIITPLVQGFPCTGALARTATSIKAGAKTPLAGYFKAVLKLILAFYLAHHKAVYLNFYKIPH
jgi:hypothetical protein